MLNCPSGCARPFDGGDAVAVRLHGVHQARAHRRAVEHHRAGAADAVLAADMRAGEIQVLAQPVDQRGARGDMAGAFHAVDVDGDGIERLAHRTVLAAS